MERWHKNFEGLMIAPKLIIQRFSDIVDIYGKEKAIYSRSFQHEREAWVTAMFLLGLKGVTGHDYWLEVETKENTPDTYGYYIEIVDNKNYRHILSFEVTEWEKHSNFINVIKNKVSKAYPSHYILLVYIARQGESINLDELFNQVAELKVPFVEIWTVAAYTHDDYQLTKMYPNKDIIRFNLADAIKRDGEQIEFLTVLHKRSKKTEWTNLGFKFFPIIGPESENKS